MTNVRSALIAVVLAALASLVVAASAHAAEPVQLGALTGEWLAPVGPPFYAQPAVGVDATGNVTVALNRTPDLGISVIERDAASGAWSAPLDLGASFGAIGRPGLSVNARGDALVAWWGPAPAADPRPALLARFRPAGGTWGPVETIAGPPATAPGGENLVTPLVHLDVGGGAVAVWSLREPGNFDAFRFGDHESIQAGSRTASGWSAPIELGQARTADLRLRLAGNAAGEAVALWTEFAPAIIGPPLPGDPRQAIRAATRSGATGTWGPATDVFRSPDPADFPFTSAVAVTPDGTAHALVALRHLKPDPVLGDQAIWASRQVPGGAWEAPVPVSTPELGVWASDAWTGVDSAGRITAVWRAQRVQFPDLGTP